MRWKDGTIVTATTYSASSEADCECPLYEKRASAAGNKSEIQAALSGTDHTEKEG